MARKRAPLGALPSKGQPKPGVVSRELPPSHFEEGNQMKVGRGKGKLKVIGDAETSSIHKGRFASKGGKKKSK